MDEPSLENLLARPRLLVVQINLAVVAVAQEPRLHRMVGKSQHLVIRFNGKYTLFMHIIPALDISGRI